MSSILCLLQKEQRKGPGGNARDSTRQPKPFQRQIVTSAGPTDSGMKQNHLATKSQTRNLRHLMGKILQWRKSLDYPTSRFLSRWPSY